MVWNNFNEESEGKPSVIAQYPRDDSKKAEKDFGNLIYACFPNDIESEVFSERENKTKLFSHNFVYMISTDGEGVRSYWTFLNFFELVLKDNGLPMIIPKSIWVISNDCLYESQTQFLQIIFKNVIFVNNIKSILALYDDPANYLLSVSMAIQWDIKDDWEKYIKSQLEYFISFYFHYLKLPDDKVNFAVHWEENQLITFRNTNATENLFVVENFSYKLLLTRIKPHRILELINAILLERPIFIIDNNMSEMALILKSILSLIKPLWWVNPLVPMIPENLAEIVGSPFGALIGIHSDIWTEWWEEADDIISDDAYILFLDEDDTKWENDLIQIPFYDELLNSIDHIIELINSTDIDWKLRKECQQIFKQAGIDRELNINDYSIYAQLKLNQEFFYVIFWRVFKSINKYINFNQDKEMYLQKVQGYKIFDSDSFLNSIHDDDYEFVKQMINTQTFTSFVDKSFKVRNNLLTDDEKDSEKIQFFYRCLSTLHNSSYKQLREALEKHVIQAVRDYYLNIENISFEDFKSKYFEKLASSFEGNMTPKVYLMQDSVVNSDRQLSVIYKINDKLIMKNIEPPIKIENQVWNERK